MSKAIDFLHQEIREGAFVTFVEPDYRNMTLGKVIKVTPCKVKILWKRNIGDKYHSRETYRYHSQVVKYIGCYASINPETFEYQEVLR